MRHIAPAVMLLALALAGCGSDGAKNGSAGSFLTGLPGGQNFTGQGDMGTGVVGNSEGEGGPSQVAVPDYGHGRNAIRP